MFNREEFERRRAASARNIRIENARSAWDMWVGDAIDPRDRERLNADDRLSRWEEAASKVRSDELVEAARETGDQVYNRMAIDVRQRERDRVRQRDRARD